MEFIDNNGEVERVYEVYVDKEKLNVLLDKVIKETSYREIGDFELPYNASFEGNRITSGAKLLNGDPMFEDIKRIYPDKLYGENSSFSDGIIYKVEGVKVVVPDLAKVLNDIRKGIYGSINNLFEYSKNPELIPIQDKIDEANKQVDFIDNYEVDEKIEALKSLKKLIDDLNDGRYFDEVLLKEYYNEAFSLISLELKSEKVIRKGKRIVLEQFKPLGR